MTRKALIFDPQPAPRRRDHLWLLPPLPEPTKLDRAVSRAAVAKNHVRDGVRELNLSGREVLVGAVGVVALTAAAIWGVNVSGARQEQATRDPRVEVNETHEKRVLTSFLASGKPELQVDGVNITTMPGSVRVTQTGKDPVNLRTTLDSQESLAQIDQHMWVDNVIAQASRVELLNPLVATLPNGDVYMGGIMRGEDGKIPVVATPEAFAEHVAWIRVSALENDYSGAQVVQEPSGGAPFAVTFGQNGLQTSTGEAMPGVLPTPALQ